MSLTTIKMISPRCKRFPYATGHGALLLKVHSTLTQLLFRNKYKLIIGNTHLHWVPRHYKVNAQLRSGHCIGCFYIESPAMRGLLKKLRCDNYLHLVAASSSSARAWRSRA